MSETTTQQNSKIHDFTQRTSSSLQHRILCFIYWKRIVNSPNGYVYRFMGPLNQAQASDQFLATTKLAFTYGWTWEIEHKMYCILLTWVSVWDSAPYFPHQSTKKCKYRSSEKYSNTYYQNKQNINPECACNIYLINSIILFYLFIFKLNLRTLFCLTKRWQIQIIYRFTWKYIICLRCVCLKLADCFLRSLSLNTKYKPWMCV
jgi:hypothetical protein